MSVGMMNEVCDKWFEQEVHERNLIFPDTIMMGEI